MKKTISTLCALALLVPVSAFAQNSNGQNNRNDNNRSESMRGDQNSNDKKGSEKPRDNNNARDNNRNPAPAQKFSNNGHKFAKGQRFERAKATNYGRVDYRQHRQLSAPPRGYVWVRSGNDALLVRLSNNLISRIVAGVY